MWLCGSGRREGVRYGARLKGRPPLALGTARGQGQAGSPYIWRNRQTVLNRLVCAVAGATLTEDVAAYALAPTREHDAHARWTHEHEGIVQQLFNATRT